MEQKGKGTHGQQCGDSTGRNYKGNNGNGKTQ